MFPSCEGCRITAPSTTATSWSWLSGSHTCMSVCTLSLRDLLWQSVLSREPEAQVLRLARLTTLSELRGELHAIILNPRLCMASCALSSASYPGLDVGDMPIPEPPRIQRSPTKWLKASICWSEPGCKPCPPCISIVNSRLTPSCAWMRSWIHG